MVASRLATHWLPVVVWAGLIFVLSAQPDLSSGLGAWDEVLRALAHLVEYAVFGALLLRAFAHRLHAFGAGVAYAVTDEIHQTFVRGRSGSVFDVAVDAAGVVLGILLFERLART